MLCSIVIPTYNRMESLRRTLDALSRQTLDSSEFEVLAISDGSKDGTWEMLREYEAASRFQLRPFAQDNAGPAAARNLGLQQASSEVIVFIDDDVEPAPVCLERHLSRHAADSRAVVLGPLSPNPRFVAAEPAWIAWEHAKLQTTYALFRPGGVFYGVDPGPEHFYSGNASVRREWLMQVGGFDTQFKRQEDVELAVRLSLKCDLRFTWEFAADGLHHPVRSLRSWLAIPSAYGALDAERVLSGTLLESDVARNTAQRHPLTQKLVSLGIAAPFLVPVIAGMLSATAAALDKAGRRPAALSGLSAAYNLLYSTAYDEGISHAPAAAPVETRLAA